jgi:hypothetical protein
LCHYSGSSFVFFPETLSLPCTVLIYASRTFLRMHDIVNECTCLWGVHFFWILAMHMDTVSSRGQCTYMLYKEENICGPKIDGFAPGCYEVLDPLLAFTKSPFIAW